MPETLNLRNPRHTSHFESHRYLLTRLNHGERGIHSESKWKHMKLNGSK